MNFEFNEWKDLYVADPAAFEEKRIDALQGYIDSVEEKGRKALEQTLFRIEMTRRRSKSPLQSAIEASRLMWESFDKLKDSLEELQSAAQHYEEQAKDSRRSNSNTLTLVDNASVQDEPTKPEPTSVEPAPQPLSRPAATVIQFKSR